MLDSHDDDSQPSIDTADAVHPDQSDSIADPPRPHPDDSHADMDVDEPFLSADQQSSPTTFKLLTPKAEPAPMLDRPIHSPPSIQAQDAVSVHSLPVVHVSQPPSSPTRPATARSAARTPDPSDESRLAPATSTRTVISAGDSPTPRLNARRAEPRSSANRLSGFFSNLIHRREPLGVPSSTPIREEAGNEPSEANSRSSSPLPTRPVTPPPSLPPPTLHELGLSLSALTQDLSPSHFTAPPTSGTFLAPHYLLLCHQQGLDVLPLVSPPAPQPYALIRRVSFKSVVVMEHRGVLVAIAGRRDGVRVYALEEVKKAVEWRIDMEVRKERERYRREESKRGGSVGSGLDHRDSSERRGKTSLSTPPPSEPPRASKLTRRPSQSVSPMPSAPKKPRPPTMQPSTTLPPPGRPPPYSTIAETVRPRLRNQPSAVSINIQRPRGSSVSHVVVPPVPRSPTPPLPGTSAEEGPSRERRDSKSGAWMEHGSDDGEAIDVLTAGASGSQALDERTSAIPPARDGADRESTQTSRPLSVRSQTLQGSRRGRPGNLDLSRSRANTGPDPVPSPNLLTLRQALVQGPSSDAGTEMSSGAAPDADEDEEDERPVVRGERITLAQALMESRLPELPPAGSVQPQEPILLSATRSSREVDDDPPPSAYATDAQSSHSRPSVNRRRRRWSVLGNILTGPSQDQGQDMHGVESPLASPTSGASQTVPEVETRPLTRSMSNRSRQTNHPRASEPRRPSTASGHTGAPSLPRSLPPEDTPPVPPFPSSSRFSRFFSGAFGPRRSEERPIALNIKGFETDHKKSGSQTPTTPHIPPPKLEYVKLPGTKSSLLIKAVETPKKSFLAILCGENGEKVELFAGTYKTALGLSRTFILPDSPRSLELQLQGDDLVEVFLVFPQNVFGLEPATVRVREVRIGRAERRAARRRVREIRSGQGNDVFDTDPAPAEDEDTNINISIGLTPPHPAEDRPSNSNVQLSDATNTPTGSTHGSALAHAEELVALASAQVGPYTSFQQLSFAPKFPLATIADDYIIPPTYPDFLDYRSEFEPDMSGSDLANIQFSPPGLPMPAPSPPSKWFYKDPKGNIHGPWKASLMQSWYKEGLLPPDLPVRKEEDEDYTLLKDLRQQCIDPMHPFRTAAPPVTTQTALPMPNASKPLLAPISLLVQPRHFGPPALFFSTRGGHSTSIVDARGRSVLKGKFVWSADPEEGSRPVFKMGDVKRLEAFDVKERSIIVAMRQGGLEAMDFGDALMKPADESRTLLPNFTPPPSNTNRRRPFVWKIGTPIASSSNPVAALTQRVKGGKKSNHTPGKSPARSEFGGATDGELESADEFLFMGRKEDEIYLCERNAGAFRILRLGPETS